MKTHHTETDVLRLTASFSVALLHSAAARMSGMEPAADGAWVPCLLNALCRFGVPVFVMISGRYMLASECSIRRAGSKAAKTLGALLLWSSVYLGYALLAGWRPAGTGDVIWRLLTEPVHLWYFYAAAALYLLAPVLSVFTRHATHRQFLYGLALTGTMGCVVVILLRTGRFPMLSAIMEQTKLPYTTGFLFCYLLGYYLFRYPLGRRGLILLGGAGILGWAATFAGKLSLLDRKRLEIGMALASKPKLLLFDEVAGGLTESEVGNILEIVKRIKAEGYSVIWIEHVIQTMLKGTDRVLLLADGHDVLSGAPAEVMSSEEVERIYLGVKNSHA